MMKRIFLVRHGETEYNARGICQGQLLDVGLNKHGREQAQNLAAMLQEKNIGAIYSSPLKRARQTADIIAQSLNLPVNEHPQLVEGSFGAADGTSMDIVRTWSTYPLWINPDPKYDDVHYANGESKRQIRARVLAALNEICTHEKAENILIVAHSAIVRFLSWAIGQYIQQVPNGAVFEFIFENGALLPARPEKLLLLSCCAPCSCAVIKTLAEAKRNFTVVFYNPNIRPYAEYLKRRDENERVCRLYGVDFVELEYDNERWCVLTKGLENEPERGKRCSVCFEMRLKRAMEYALANGYTAVASVLGVSRWKNLAQVDAAAHDASAATGCLYINVEGRKNGMQELRAELIKELNLYNQIYCGCKPQNKIGEN